MQKNGHLTPSLLQQELENFKAARGYLPRVIAVHLNPDNEDEIKTEASIVSRNIGTSIELAYEGMQIEI